MVAIKNWIMNAYKLNVLRRSAGKMEGTKSRRGRQREREGGREGGRECEEKGVCDP